MGFFFSVPQFKIRFFQFWSSRPFLFPVRVRSFFRFWFCLPFASVSFPGFGLRFVLSLFPSREFLVVWFWFCSGCVTAGFIHSFTRQLQEQNPNILLEKRAQNYASGAAPAVEGKWAVAWVGDPRAQDLFAPPIFTASSNQAGPKPLGATVGGTP